MLGTSADDSTLVPGLVVILVDSKYDTLATCTACCCSCSCLPEARGGTLRYNSCSLARCGDLVGPSSTQVMTMLSHAFLFFSTAAVAILTDRQSRIQTCPGLFSGAATYNVKCNTQLYDMVVGCLTHELSYS